MKNVLASLAIAALVGACNQGAGEAPEQTVQQLMANEVQPTAEVYWQSVQYISDAEGMHEIVPRTDADWKRTRDAATKIGQLGALLKSPAYAAGRNEDWVTFANSLIEVSKLAEQAADARDVEKTFEVGGTMYSVCSACHQVYPSTTEAEGGEVERPDGEAEG